MERLKRTALFLIVLVFGAIVLQEGSFILVPLVWGVFFSFALSPIADWLDSKGLPRSISIIMSILLVTLVAGGIVYVLLNQMIGLVKDIPEIGENFNKKIGAYIEELEGLLGRKMFETQNQEELWSVFKIENLNETLFATGKSLTLAGIIPLYIFLLMYYRDFFVTFLIKYSEKSKERILTWAKDSGKVIQSYLTGMILVTMIVAVLSGIFFFSDRSQILSIVRSFYSCSQFDPICRCICFFFICDSICFSHDRLHALSIDDFRGTLGNSIARKQYHHSLGGGFSCQSQCLGCDFSDSFGRVALGNLRNGPFYSTGRGFKNHFGKIFWTRGIWIFA